MLVKFHTWWRTAEPELLSGPTALNNLLLGSSSGKNTGFEVRFKKWLYIEITKSESRLHMRTLGPRDNGLPDTPPCSHCQNKKTQESFYFARRTHTIKPESTGRKRAVLSVSCFQCGYHRNQTRPTWALLVRLPFTRPRRNSISRPPTNVSTMAKNESGKTTCPTIMVVISRRWDLEDFFFLFLFSIFNCGNIDI